MVQNAVQNAAKCETKSINIRCNGINKTFSNHEKQGRKGRNSRQKVEFLGIKSGLLGFKNYELATKLER